VLEFVGAMTNNPKLFGAFLNGVHRRIFEDDKEITVEYLKDQIFSAEDVTINQLSTLFDKCQEILKQAAREDWELQQLEMFLKQSSQFSSAQQDVFVRFWRVQKPKIRESLLKHVSWNNSLTKIAWRIDSKTQSMAAAELNELTAIVELNLSANNNVEVVRFEMDKAQLDQILEEVTAIQKHLLKYAS